MSIKLTDKQKIILTAVTGFNCCDSFADFHYAVEGKLGRPVFTHEFANVQLAEKIKDAFHADFKEEFLGIEEEK